MGKDHRGGTGTLGDVVFALDDEPGIERHGRRRFRYVDQASGEPVTDDETLMRIRALTIPPAWTDVWIAGDPCGHLQATGRDAKGRKQYRYHDSFRAHQEEAKFAQLVAFGKSLPLLRRRVERDLSRRGLPEAKVIALVVRLLEETFVRVGNEKYARVNGSYGLTTLRARHVQLDGSRVRIRFRAKSAKTHDVLIDDPRLARLVRRCQDLPGQVLFQYVDDDGVPHPVHSTDVNDYLRAVTGEMWTAKTFRTWAATTLAAAGLGVLDPPASQREGRQIVSALMKAVAARLDNTPAVCRRSYVHPGVVDNYLAGNFAEEWAACSGRGSAWLSPDERRLLHLLPTLPPACD